MYLRSIHCVILCLTAFLLNCGNTLPGGGARSVTSARNKQYRKCTAKSYFMNVNYSSIDSAKKFLEHTNEMDIKLTRNVTLAIFNYSTNMTEHNEKIKHLTYQQYMKFYTLAVAAAKGFNWKSFKDKNETLYRWFKLFLGPPAFESHLLSSMFALSNNAAEEEKSADKIFSEVRMCPFNFSMNAEECTINIYPDMVEIVATSRNESELQHFWKTFRDLTGRRMRRSYINRIKASQVYAGRMSLASFENILASYETQSFMEDISKLFQKILTIYRLLHAYVRQKLIEKYSNVTKSGPIPAHLLGSLYGENWEHIFDIVNPFPEKNLPNVTVFMTKKEMQPLDLYIMAEDFFVSMGLKEMTPYFWAKSVFEKPLDRDMFCYPEVMDFLDGKDYRIKTCTRINFEGLQAVYRQMGHVEYSMLYSHLPLVFRRPSNPGFLDSVGGVVALALFTPAYQKKVGLIDKDFDDKDKDLNIMILLKVALQYLPIVPFAYVVDSYRYSVHNGSITPEELNKKWWKYRLTYQGLCPPVKRTEEDFDAGSNFHVADGTDYIRLFFSSVVTFQMHKALCVEAGYKGPLHKCNIYGNKKAGVLLKKVLKLGKSKPWKEVMLILTNQESNQLKYDPIDEYFDPLINWLVKRDVNIGWDTYDDPMMCPSKEEEKH